MKFIKLTADNNLPGSGLLKRFSGKIAGIIVTGHEAGAAMTISSLYMTLNNYGMLFPPFSHLYAMSSVCSPTYKDKPIVLNDCFAEELKTLANNVILAAKLVKNCRPTDWKNNYSAN